jgi:hypothetical protein
VDGKLAQDLRGPGYEVKREVAEVAKLFNVHMSHNVQHLAEGSRCNAAHGSGWVIHFLCHAQGGLSAEIVILQGVLNMNRHGSGITMLTVVSVSVAITCACSIDPADEFAATHNTPAESISPEAGTDSGNHAVSDSSTFRDTAPNGDAKDPVEASLACPTPGREVQRIETLISPYNGANLWSGDRLYNDRTSVADGTLACNHVLAIEFTLRSPSPTKQFSFLPGNFGGIDSAEVAYSRCAGSFDPSHFVQPGNPSNKKRANTVQFYDFDSNYGVVPGEKVYFNLRFPACIEPMSFLVSFR